MASDDRPLFDEEQAARYEERWAKLAPFVQTIHLLAGSALRHLGDGARVLVVGAGTGAELGALAQQYPTWRFTAVDPAEPMLGRAEKRMKELGVAERCRFVVGTLEALEPTDPFDGATSILVSHFTVDRPDRVRFFRQIRDRLAPGAPLVTADLSAPSMDGPLGEVWDGLLEAVGLDPEEIAGYRSRIGTHVAMLQPGEVASIVHDGGFEAVEPVFQAAWMRAWVARARA